MTRDVPMKLIHASLVTRGLDPRVHLCAPGMGIDLEVKVLS
jgi:hypothetical protein